MFSSLKRGVTIINGLDANKLYLFLNKIVLEIKQNPNSISMFNEEERGKLMNNFDLDERSLELLINSCTIILCQVR